MKTVTNCLRRHSKEKIFDENTYLSRLSTLAAIEQSLTCLLSLILYHHRRPKLPKIIESNMGRESDRKAQGVKRKRRTGSSPGRREKAEKEAITEEVESEQMLATMTTEEKCDLIASLSEQVVEDPSNAFKQEKEESVVKQGDNEESEARTRRMPSKMQQLLDLGRVYKNGNDEYTASLAIMSLLAIFKDIIPAYRIRLHTETEREVKLSKETKQLWDYERALLTHYQQYLQLLEKCWTQGQVKGNPPSRLAVTSILSLCELLKTAFHFNFRSNILALVVRQMNNRQCDQVSQACCEAVEHVFQKDAQGEVAMETARLVAKMIKDYRGELRPAVLRTFVKLPLRVHVDEAQAAKLATAANKKRKKKDRDLAEIEAELKEGSASVDKIVLARSQSETLQCVILSYFRILKSHDASLKVDLLPAALEGLAKFSHLINIDTVIDLLEILKQLLVQVDNLPLEASLNCVLTAFQTLQGPGKEMQIDPKEYITPLYSQLARLGTEGNSRANTEIALRCLEFAFIRRRELSTVRVAAFIKQILSVALHATAFSSVPLIAFARQMFQRYPSVHQLLENESDVITSGQYNGDVADPEHSNPFSTSAWELANLKFHLDPNVAEQGQAAATLKMLAMPGEAPERLLADLLRDTDEVHISFRRLQKNHPLLGRSAGKKQQLRFVTPRKKFVTLL